MRCEWDGIPNVLIKKLLVNGSLSIGVLASGLFMESRQPGNGFFQLTGLCALVLLSRFLFMLWTFLEKNYMVLEGEITDILKNRKWEKYREVKLKTQNGTVERICLSNSEQICLGEKYRIFLKNGEVWGMEKMEDE